MARPTFHYTKAPPTQVLSGAVIIGLAYGATLLPGSATAWARFVGATPEWVLIVVVPWVLHLALFWSVSLAFHYVDTTDRPEIVRRYRIQRGKPVKPPLSKVLPNLAVNQLFWSPLMLLVIWGLLKLRGWAPLPVFPGPLQLAWELVGMGALSILWFYASHRFLHRKWWMQKVHRVHHEFRTTTAMASEYAHWVEFTAGSFGTIAVGVVALAPSLFAIYLYTVLSLSTVLAHHSGYALPFVSWPVHHDWHHYRVKECFGTIGLLDRLFGTDTELRTLEHDEER
ncbi:MAG: sterol desaturase family protein [Alphaproteobacteria bacterium]|nr:sterol desaturase family protein [Alphaproteobacteria bacterium]